MTIAISAKQTEFILAPRSCTAVVAQDTCRNLATSTAAAAVDVTEFSNTGCMIRIFNESADYLYVTFSDTSAHADDLDGTAVAGATRCDAIAPNGGVLDVVLEKGIHNFLGYRLKSGTGFMRYRPSAPGAGGGG